MQVEHESELSTIKLDHTPFFYLVNGCSYSSGTCGGYQVYRIQLFRLMEPTLGRIAHSQNILQLVDPAGCPFKSARPKSSKRYFGSFDFGRLH